MAKIGLWRSLRSHFGIIDTMESSYQIPGIMQSASRFLGLEMVENSGFLSVQYSHVPGSIHSSITRLVTTC